MNKFTVAARNVLLCALVTLPLAACGGGSDADSAAVASTSADTQTSSALVEQNVGMIDRSQTDGSASAASVASNTTTAAAPKTAAATPVRTSGSGASAGTVAKVTQPVKPITTTEGVATPDWTARPRTTCPRA